MRVVIDTCSLLSLARYYLPFDNDQVLYNFIKKRAANNEIIIIDKVFRECGKVAEGLVIDSLHFLSEKPFTKAAKIPYDTSTLVAPDPKDLFHKIDTLFTNHDIIRKRGLDSAEYESQIYRFIKSADMTQIIFCLRMLEDRVPIALVTEETEYNNDNKPFKKIPAICSELGIRTMTLPEYLKLSEGINLTFI